MLPKHTLTLHLYPCCGDQRDNLKSVIARVHLALIAAAWFLSLWPFDAIAQARTATSLSDKSNEELLQIMIGGKNERKIKKATEIDTHLPERFFDMPPKDAALALIEENCDSPTRQKLQFSFDATADTGPPAKGEIGLRWECSHCYLAERGLTILHYAGAKSSLSYSRVQLDGSTTKNAIQHAVDQTKSLPLREELALQIYETIWWLVRIVFPKRKNPKTRLQKASASKLRASCLARAMAKDDSGYFLVNTQPTSHCVMR